MATDTKTGGRSATEAVIGGGLAIAVGRPQVPTPRGFSWRPLAELARLETGHTPSRRQPEYWDGDIPWIGIRDATRNHGRTISSTAQYVTQDGIDNSSARVLPAGTVCLSRTASVGYVVVMGVPMATSQDFVNWVCGPELNPKYLKYALQADRDALLRFANGSTHQTIYFPEVKAFHILLPTLAEQRGIAATLGVLDDKIESNRRIVSAITQLMHSRMVAAVAGEAPMVPVSSLASFVNGGAYTKDASGTGRMVIRIAELNKGPGDSTVYNDIDVPDDKTARAGDILMSWSGSLGVYRWSREEAIINQHIFKVIPEGYPPWLVFDRLEAALEVFRGIARDKATTMGHIQRGHLDSTVVEIPSAETVRGLDTILGPLWDRMHVAETESLKLAALRDALVPELLSGRIRVPEAAEVVQEAVG